MNEQDLRRRGATLERIQQLIHDKVMFAPIWLNAGLHGVGPRVEESGFGHIAGYPFSAPYEDVKLKGKRAARRGGRRKAQKPHRHRNDGVPRDGNDVLAGAGEGGDEGVGPVGLTGGKPCLGTNSCARVARKALR